MSNKNEESLRSSSKANEKLEIGPYIRRTKIFDEFYGVLTGNGKKRDVLIQIFPYIYNLSEVSIKRIISVLKKLKGCPYAQEHIQSFKDKDTSIVSLVYQYYPKSVFNFPIEPISDFFTKYIPSFIYKGITCLQQLKNLDICHHDICLENIYFGSPAGNDSVINSDDDDDISNDKKKTVNQDPLNFDFRLLNWAFATISPDSKSENKSTTDDNVHAISMTPRYKYEGERISSLFKKDPHLHDIWDFGITIFSLIDRDNIPELIKQINTKYSTQNAEIKWDELLKNYHQYRKHCLTVKKIFEKIFSDQNSNNILANLIFSNLFTIDFFQSEEVVASGIYN